jgi:hypothetical protein
MRSASEQGSPRPYNWGRSDTGDGTVGSRMPTARARVEDHGWDIVSVSHEDIRLSERWREYERYLLVHERGESQSRAAGLGKTEAHARAERDDLGRFADEAERREVNARWDAGGPPPRR